MSQWDPQQPEPTSRQSSGSPARLLLVLLALAAMIACSCLGAGVLVWWHLRVGDRSRQAALEDIAQQGRFDSLDEKYAAVSAAYNAESVGVGSRGLRSIERLLDDIVAATAVGDHAAFSRNIDTELLLVEMNNSGAMEPMNVVQQALALSWLNQGSNVPGYWDDYRIVRVEPHPSGEAAIVYTYFWAEGAAEQKVRWWIVLTDGNWKVYDWELLDYGMRASKERAILYAYEGDPQLLGYLRCTSNLAGADGCIEQGDFDAAAERVRYAESLNVLPAFRDDAWLQIGNAWLRLNRFSEAMVCFQQISDPNAVPGAICGQAYCYEAWGRHRQAVRMAARYEEMLGRDPDINRLKGESLLALERPQEAVAEFRKSLDVDPERWNVLRMLGLALAEDQKSVLTRYVKRCSDPTDMATWLAEYFTYDGDPAALDAVSDLLAQIDPDPARSAYLAGLAKELMGDYAAAAELYKQAVVLEDDPELTERYVYRYLDSMISLGQPAQGYLGVPDRAAAFEYLADCYYSDEYYFPEKAFAELLDEHQRHQPDDPWLYYYRGILLMDQGKYDEAERQYLVGIAKTDEEDTAAVLHQARVSALRASGRALEAYQTMGPQHYTFENLTSAYRWDDELTPEGAAELKALVEAHQAARPDDPWLDFCSAILAQYEQDYREADRLLARGHDRAEDEWTKRDYRQRRLDVRIASGDIASALDDIPPRGESFDYLAGQLLYDGRLADLESLIAAYRREAPESAAGLRWQAELLWQRQDYDGIIESLAPWSPETARELDDWERSGLAEKLVRSYLRLNRTTQARQAAKTVYDLGESLPLILVSTVERNLPETTQLMIELRTQQYMLTRLYYDEDIGGILRSDEFRPLREECPPGLPYGMAGASVLLLLRDSRQPDQAQLAGLLGEHLGEEVTLNRLPQQPQADSPVSFVADTGAGVYCLTFGSDRYEVDEADRRKLGSAVLEAIEQHRGWLGIDVSVFDDALEECQLAACRLAAVLLADDCLAVYFDNDARLAAVGPDTREMLRSVRSADELRQVGVQVWVNLAGDPDEETWHTADLRRCRLPEFCSAFAHRTPEQEFLLKINLHSGSAVEPHWVAVRRIGSGEFGSRRYVAEFTADSLLVSHFRAGEPISLDSYDIVDWTYTGADESTE